MAAHHGPCYCILSPLTTSLLFWLAVSIQAASASNNVWTVYYDGNPVLTWNQPGSQDWLRSSGPFWALGARTGAASASTYVRHVQLVALDNTDAQSSGDCQDTALSMGPMLSSNPFNYQQLMACKYKTLVSPSTHLPMLGTDSRFIGSLTEPGTVDQVYQFTQDGANSISHYIGNMKQYLQRYPRFSISFDFLMQGSGWSGDSIFLMVGADVPKSTDEFIQEDDGAGMKVVFDCYENREDLFNKVSIFEPGDYGIAASSRRLGFYQQDYGTWHTVRIDYQKAIEGVTGSDNVWTVYYDGVSVLTYHQPDSQKWLVLSGSFWALGARTGAATASMSVRHVQLVVLDTPGTHLSASCRDTALSIGPLLSSSPFDQQELTACNYKTLVSPSTQLPIWGIDKRYPGSVTAPGTLDQFYQFTQDGSGDISHYIGNNGQYLQRFSRFSLSFDFFIQGGSWPGDSIFLMVGDKSPASTHEYLTEDSGQGVNVVIDCFPGRPDLYDMITVSGPAKAGSDRKPAASSGHLGFFQQYRGSWHTVRIDYQREAEHPAGFVHQLGLPEMISWGMNSHDNLQYVTMVRGGERHAIALLYSGTVFCWGENGQGQCNIPSPVANSPAVLVAAGGNVSMALLMDATDNIHDVGTFSGRLYVWGDDTYGVVSSAPDYVDNVVAMELGGMHAVVLFSNGTVLSWGSNQAARLGVPDEVQTFGATAIAAGYDYSLALVHGSVVAWDIDSSLHTMVPSSALSDVRAIAAGTSHALALKTDGSVVSFGGDGSGSYDVPNHVESAIAIAAGNGFSVALLQSGELVVWGPNAAVVSDIPTWTTDNFKTIHAGSFSAFAITGYVPPAVEPPITTMGLPRNVYVAMGVSVVVCPAMLSVMVFILLDMTRQTFLEDLKYVLQRL